MFLVVLSGTAEQLLRNEVAKAHCRINISCDIIISPRLPSCKLDEDGDEHGQQNYRHYSENAYLLLLAGKVLLLCLNQVLMSFMHILVCPVDIFLSHVELLSLGVDESSHVLLDLEGIDHAVFDGVDFLLFQFDHALVMQSFLVDFMHLDFHAHSSLAFLLLPFEGLFALGVCMRELLLILESVFRRSLTVSFSRRS